MLWAGVEPQQTQSGNFFQLDAQRRQTARVDTVEIPRGRVEAAAGKVSVFHDLCSSFLQPARNTLPRHLLPRLPLRLGRRESFPFASILGTLSTSDKVPVRSL